MLSLPKLPFELDALEPYCSRTTLEYHHGKHHSGYVNNCNALIAGTDFSDMALEDIIKATAPAESGDLLKLFRNASQVWNHSFFWLSLSSPQQRTPVGALAEGISDAFGGFEQFQSRFKAEAVAHFGSGWIWLLQRNGALEIKTFHDAQSPLIEDVNPILVCDLWEPAYYLDYQNDRAHFVDVFLSQLVHWDFASANFTSS